MSLRAALLLLLVVAGCAVRKPPLSTWRLVTPDAHSVLLPPGVSAVALDQRTFAAGVSAHPNACPPGAGGVALAFRRKRLILTVHRDLLLAQPDGWLSAWTAELEAQGCLTPGGGLALSARILEALPLPSNAAFRLLHTSHMQTGQVDLGPYTRLQVITPIQKDGAVSHAPNFDLREVTGGGSSLTATVSSTANLLGYETAWYAVRPKPLGPGYTIVPLFAERHIQGTTERREPPGTNWFAFPAEAAFYRLFYKANQTEFTALALAGRTRAELDERTRTIQSGATPVGPLCLAIPKRVAVNPFLAVTVNETEILVHWGGTVASALAEAGDRSGAVPPAQLAVYRAYRGHPVKVEFDPASPAILSLPLLGGEVLALESPPAELRAH